MPHVYWLRVLYPNRHRLLGLLLIYLLDNHQLRRYYGPLRLRNGDNSKLRTARL